MIPRTILNQLAKLQRREMLLRLAWGAARWLTVVIVLLILACTVDYVIDRSDYEETPWELRVAMLAVQLLAAAGTGFWWLVWPLLRRPSDAELALWVEDKMPGFRHRLISAVQLNQPGARTEGMSAELIAVVTREAERQAERAAFAALADQRRFLWSAALGGPVVLASLLLLILIPVAPILLARQLLGNWDVPRDIYLVSDTKKVWPAGEPVLLEFKVTGKGVDENLEGWAHVYPGGNDDPASNERYALTFKEFTWAIKCLIRGQANELKRPGEETMQDLNVTGLIVEDAPDYLLLRGPTQHYKIAKKDIVAKAQVGAIYFAQVPPSNVNFTYKATLGDGRTKKISEVILVPRPIVTEVTATVQLPLSCGVRPVSGKPRRGKSFFRSGDYHERCYDQGEGPSDIVGIPGSAALVTVKVQKPVKVAALHLLGDKRETVPLRLDPSGKVATGSFPLDPKVTDYEIAVADEYGFGNNPRPKRTIKLVPEETPQVSLLPTYLPAISLLAITEDDILDGMPIKPGDPIPVAYRCSGPFGLGEAHLRYRFTKPPILTDKDNGASLKLARGEVVTIRLHGAPKDGARWEVVKIDSDKLITQAEPEVRVPKKEQPDDLGSTTFRFKGEDSGTTELEIHYRFPDKKQAAEKTFALSVDVGDKPFADLPLPEVKGSADAGPFLPLLGRFRNNIDVHFHAVPSPNPEIILGRQSGGGTFNFQTSDLYYQGKKVLLEPGDQIEFYIEVYAGQPGDDRPVARTETRTVSVVTPAEWQRWFSELKNEEDRIRNLDKKQRGVFDK